MNRFDEDLAYSQSMSDKLWWFDVYSRAFHNIASISDVRDDGWAQRGGIDRVIVLKSGRVITVDEKVRKKDWGDILLERWSDEQRQKPGWIQKDLACDYIAYAFEQSQRCYMLPFLPLRELWLTKGKEWISEHKTVRAQNPGYTTASIAVPIDILLDSLRETMVVTWGGK